MREWQNMHNKIWLVDMILKKRIAGMCVGVV